MNLALTLLLIPPITIIFLVTAILLKANSSSSVIHWSTRVGRDNKTFKMPKFRSMRVGTPAVATHLMTDPEQFLSPIGKLLRKYSIDEFPQLFSILKGDMSFVGPRPALFNQHDLIALRTEKRVNQLVPGLTGWAQVNGRDELPIPEKVVFDVEIHDALDQVGKATHTRFMIEMAGQKGRLEKKATKAKEAGVL